jgi:hypothetical protein
MTRMSTRRREWQQKEASIMADDLAPERAETPSTVPPDVPGRVAATEGAARFVTTGVLRAARVLSEPLAPRLHRTPAPMPFLKGLVGLGRGLGAAATAEAERAARAAARGMVLAVLDDLDLTAVVRERVDLNALAKELDLDAIVAQVDIEKILARVDVDAVAARLDLDAVVARIDLIALAQLVVDGIDLPGIIRESTGTMASQAVRDVRLQSLEADEAVSRAAGRWLTRRHAPGPEEAAAVPTPREPGGDDGQP